MKDYERFLPVEIERALGSHIYSRNGHKIIDAISSWWCKSLGHNHPRLKKAMLTQLEKFEHVIMANSTHDTIVELSEKLCSLTPHLNKVFYAGDGSCSIEVALKMSLHAQQLKGEAQRKYILSLENGYHGETIAALSVSDLGLYNAPYEPLMFKAYKINGLPYVSGIHDPLWENCEHYWGNIEKQLAPFATEAAALIVEPLVQAAGHMKIYAKDLLTRLRQWCKQNDVYLIADEIMTGLGRTGKMLACEHAGIAPDFVCLSKGLTSGWMPFSCTLTHDEIYDLFYDDYESGKAFMHSHTFSGNALAASVANETLTVLREEKICERVQEMAIQMLTHMKAVADETKLLCNIRSLGAIVAADINIKNANNARLGYQVFQHAIKLGAWLRPLANTIYWVPPLNTSWQTLDELREITKLSLLNCECYKVKNNL